MNKFNLVFVLLFILFPAKGSARTQVGTSQLKEDSLKSELLHVTRQYSVYLPESYTQSKSKEYPVLYLLHGHSHTNRDWGKDSKLQEIADGLINAGKVCEMIIIMPDAGRIQNGYFDMKGWAYEQFFFEEFLPSVEKKYRIKRDKSSRAIAGFSMGGGGATAYALKHPDLFSSVYAMSALMSLPEQERPQAMDSTFMRFGRSVLANDCIVLVNYTDLATLEKLRTIRWFVDCGDDDFLLNVNFLFYKAMQDAKIPCELRVRDGNHNWDYWCGSLYLALPFVSKNFGK
ncbi:MAG: alpha/beta hydrolase family protein [Massilibacteroides sp.]|nr:alpha/beta hydrolase family protein [Massilibacteroides sp.]MDD3062391.1 alpha/beta hydrolase family protein [Massilibacteroides sp.]MDD4116070.1 alpha/beta hydrolase family protein [Massilibacteroides sp.]MDD4661207.1 alpha/beta hydrolase family protein [Massilibacteroides sp.]